jgi:hypothetical protein
VKIELERTLSNCPSNLKCVACSQSFKTGKIRRLLCDRAGLIQGDLCSSCGSAKDLQQKLQTPETISRPKFYQWLFKRLTILSEATQEIEQARFASGVCGCRKSKQLRIRFQQED